MHAWFDISAGVAGDMLLGALVDAGVGLPALQSAVDAVVPGSVRLGREDTVRAGQRATKVRVEVLVDDPPHREWSTIREMLGQAELAAQTRAWAMDTFEVLAGAEGWVHGVDPATVHFHEVGALDSIADVVASCEALRLLGVTSISASPVRLGAGRVRAAHGDIPVPVPAVAALSVGWEVYATPEHLPVVDSGGHSHAHGDDHHHHDTPARVTTQGSAGELATPTGMALVRALAGRRCEPLPGMIVARLGIGAGGKDFAGWPNIVRVVLGELAARDDQGAIDMAEIRANVDDLDPRMWPGVLDRLLAAGAVDAWLTPIHMKKGRPAFTINALADVHRRPAVIDAMLAHTPTLGIRWTHVARTVLDRTWASVDVRGQRVRVKIGARQGIILHATPEFAEVAEAAAALGIPESEVLARAQAAAAASGLLPGERITP